MSKERSAHPTCDDWRELEAIISRFEQAWRDGSQPPLADFLPPDGPTPSPLLRELVHIDLEFRLKNGEPVRVEAYLERFPELARDPDAAVQLISAEYELRSRQEPRLAPNDYRQRFPHLGPLLEMALTPRPSRATPTPGRAGGQESTESWRAGPRSRGDNAILDPALLADFEVLGEIGRGGMGVVYRVRDRRRQAVVALKTLQGMDPAAQVRFKQEFRFLVGVAHPNLVTLYELRAEGPLWFFTMELIDGCEFLSHVRPFFSPTQAELCTDRLREAFRQLAEGLTALHAAGKLHRDVKPSNVLVTPAGRVVLLDFGLAAELDPRGIYDGAGQHLQGTIAYMAPEQALTLPLTTAADWYSVGVMLYEALTGSLPFAGRAEDILAAKANSDPPPPDAHLSSLPDDLSRLCLDLLRRDPAARPSGAEVLACLGHKSAVAPGRKEVPLIGREPQLRVLRAAFADVQQGQAVAVMVGGRSGMGKSSLVHHFLHEAERDGALVFMGQCYEQESVPFKAFDSLIDSLAQYLTHLPPGEAQAILPRYFGSLARVFPVLHSLAKREGRGRVDSGSDLQEERRRAFAALRELLTRLRRPLVICLDDLQWGDADSAALLLELTRLPDPPLFLFVGCYRDEEMDSNPFLRALGGLPERRDVQVGPLTAAEARELAGQLLSGASADDAEALAGASEGSPFFVHELAQGLTSAARRTEREKMSLEEVVWQRVERLPEATRQLLEVVAVAGRPINETVAAQAAGLGSTAQSAVVELRAGRLIRGGSSVAGHLATYHDRIRESVTVHLAEARRRDVHGLLARALEGAGIADPEWLGFHFEGAGDTERAAGLYLDAAAQAAESLAFEQAVRLYRHGLQLRSLEGPEQWRVRVRLGDALANAGRGADAAAEYLAAAQGVGSDEALDLRRRATQQLLMSGQIDAGLRVARDLLQAVGLHWPATPRRALLGVLVRRAQLWLRGTRFQERSENSVSEWLLRRIDISWAMTVGLGTTDVIRGTYFHARNQLLALQAGEPYRVARALAFGAMQEGCAGLPSSRKVAAMLAEAAALADRIENPHARGMVLLCRGMSAYLRGEWRSSLDSVRAAEVIFRDHCTGTYWELNNAQMIALYALIYLGELTELAWRCATVQQEAHEKGDLYAEAVVQSYAQPMLQLVAGKVEEGSRDLEEMWRRWSNQAIHLQHLNILYRQTEMELYRGTVGRALERAEELHRIGNRSIILARVQHCRMVMRYLHGCARLAATAENRHATDFGRDVQRNARQLEREGRTDAAAMASVLRGGLAWTHGNRDSAAEFYRRGEEGFAAAEMSLHAAAARRRRGQLIGGAEGQRLVADANGWMSRQGIVAPERMTAVLAPAPEQ